MRFEDEVRAKRAAVVHELQGKVVEILDDVDAGRSLLCFELCLRLS